MSLGRSVHIARAWTRGGQMLAEFSAGSLSASTPETSKTPRDLLDKLKRLADSLSALPGLKSRSSR